MPKQKITQPDQNDPDRLRTRIGKLEKALAAAIVAINRWGSRAGTFVEMQTLQNDIDKATKALSDDE